MTSYIVCLSNLSVPTVLTVCKEYEKVKIVTDQPSIYDFFTALFGKDAVIKIDPLPVLKGAKKLLAPLLLKPYKKSLIKKLGKPVGCHIYIFYNAYGVQVSWWLKTVSRTNMIFYKPDLDISMWPTKYSPKSIAEIFLYYLSFGVWVVPAWNGQRNFPKISNHFLKEQGILLQKQMPIDFVYISSLVNEKFALSGKRILLLTGNNVKDNLIHTDEFERKNDMLIDLLEPDQIAVKVHPRFDFLHSRENDCTIIPSFIPANVILPNFEIFIGYTSSVLFEAANESKLAISLIDYFEPISEERRSTYKEYLLKNVSKDSTIYFPTTLNEVADIMKESNEKFY